MKPLLFVPSHNDVAQDVLCEADRALEFARLLRRQRELEHTVVTITVVRELVCEPAARRRGHLIDLAAEGRDRVLEPLAHSVQPFLVGGRGKEIHHFVRAHSVGIPFPGLAADLWPGAKRRHGTGPRRSRTLYGMRRPRASRLGVRPGLAWREGRAPRAECRKCGRPLFPVSEPSEAVTLECANRHPAIAPLPDDRAIRALIDNWIAKKGAQLHVQHE